MAPIRLGYLRLTAHGSNRSGHRSGRGRNLTGYPNGYPTVLPLIAPRVRGWWAWLSPTSARLVPCSTEAARVLVGRPGPLRCWPDGPPRHVERHRCRADRGGQPPTAGRERGVDRSASLAAGPDVAPAAARSGASGDFTADAGSTARRGAALWRTAVLAGRSDRGDHLWLHPRGRRSTSPRPRSGHLEASKRQLGDGPTYPADGRTSQPARAPALVLSSARGHRCGCGPAGDPGQSPHHRRDTTSAGSRGRPGALGRGPADPRTGSAAPRVAGGRRGSVVGSRSRPGCARPHLASAARCLVEPGTRGRERHPVDHAGRVVGRRGHGGDDPQSRVPRGRPPVGRHRRRRLELSSHRIVVVGVTPEQLAKDPSSVLRRIENHYVTARRSGFRPSVVATPRPAWRPAT